MHRYATVEDYEARYGTLGNTEAARVQLLLDDAAVKITALIERTGIDVEGKCDIFRVMCCEYVHYKMQFASNVGLSSVTHQAGSFMETYSLKSEMGFDKWARRHFGDVLGIATGSATTAKIAIHDRSGAIAGGLNDW
ncbi:MAG: hypothetical protein IKF14_10480 [Atopobiaceae bacterium]|nr:hypothetical protein [Atopobiaceae bacterium]